MIRRAQDPHRAIRFLRIASWAIAVLCLGTWGWARLDAARFEADAERQLARAMAADASAASRDALALELAVEQDLHDVSTGGSVLPEAGRRIEEASDTGLTAAVRDTVGAAPARAARRATAPPVTVDATEVLGRLRIPRLGLSVLVAEGIDERTLLRAAGRIPGTAPLLGSGNVGIAGHRDGVFRDLSRAASGDLVLVETPQGTARYRIEAVSIVGAQATEVLAATAQPTLTLVTCYPFDLFGPAAERWVVRAVRIGADAS